MSETVRSCGRLQQLFCVPLDRAAWIHLSNIRTLRTVWIGGECVNTLGRDNLDFTRFLNITSLSFCAKTAYILEVLEHSEFPSLNKFRMDVLVLPSAEAEQLFCALSRCNTSHTLEDVVIFSDQLGALEPSSTAIRQFFGFSQLRILRLRPCHWRLQTPQTVLSVHPDFVADADSRSAQTCTQTGHFRLVLGNLVARAVIAESLVWLRLPELIKQRNPRIVPSQPSDMSQRWLDEVSEHRLFAW
ncbi:hypothetical protein DEU56DRAFT_760887 [Suillus clintonianus]|uniref:uncharacterized protein n=1 Tax=Suillus clintonianus TaxID=1904413 RepID=UPI001B885631|nr:uncharacterized protein DEU56DRAFT_760887 [Suillus clintonianus]KAG2120240.1 hypothetical protein DEU56DRAFT_760887 [Suillus clintonianus]